MDGSLQARQTKEVAATQQRTAPDSKEDGQQPRGVALRGFEDAPTDAIRDYCHLLGEALAGQGFELDQALIPWVERGWLRGLGWLWRESAKWEGRWVLVQYTALAWSRRGFPLRLLAVLGVLKVRRVKLAVVFHDALPFPGGRLVDRLRRRCQTWVMRRCYRWTDKSILTVPLSKVYWLPREAAKAAFVPVGSTLLGLEDEAAYEGQRPEGERTVVVFGVTGGRRIAREVGDIAYVVRQVAQECLQLRIMVIGRGSEEAREALQAALQGSGVQIFALGILPGPDIKRIFSGADALLFVRGHVSSRRSSAIAAIACGLPIVGYAGDETGSPIVEAGVNLVPEGDREALAEALARVLTDAELWQTLHQRNMAAQRDYFGWDRVAERFLEILE